MDENPSGFPLLNFYLSFYLHDKPNHLDINPKKALRATCKTFKRFFDNKMKYAVIDGDFTEISSQCSLIWFDTEGWRYQMGKRPDSLLSLDRITQIFTSLEDLLVDGHSRWLPQPETVPECITRLTSLTQLEIGKTEHTGRKLVVLPDSFSQLTALKQLIIEPTSNCLDQLEHNKSLNHLELRVPYTAEFYQFPECISLLTTLRLKGRVFSFTQNIESLKQLKELNLVSMYLKTFLYYLKAPLL